MDTRFWGPSGWQLLHLIAEGSPSPGRTLALLSRILPCKFCRESTSSFASEHPLTKSANAGRWLYEIHRRVNHKLKTQADKDPSVILPDPDPTYEDVHEKYAQLLKKPPHGVPGRDFLFAIAYNFPETPEVGDVTIQQAFLKSMRVTYPFPKLRKAYVQYMQSHPLDFSSRTAYLHWMYGLLHRLSEKSGSSIRSFKGYAHHVAYYKSGCSKATYHGKTCRRLDGGGLTKNRNAQRTRRIAGGSLLS